MRKSKSRGDSVLLTTGIFALAIIIASIVHYASYASANIQTTEIRREITDVIYKEARIVDRTGKSFSLPSSTNGWNISYNIQSGQVCATATKQHMKTSFCVYKGIIE